MIYKFRVWAWLPMTTEVHLSAIDDEDAPKSIQIAPKILSSEFNVAKADDKGVGT